MVRRRRTESKVMPASAKSGDIERVDVESREFRIVTLEDWDQANEAGADLLPPGCFVYLDVPADADRAVVAAARRQLLEQGAAAVSVRRDSVDRPLPEKASHGSSMNHGPQNARIVALELVRKSRAEKNVKELATEVIEKALAEVGL